jgi:hypothetical protein
MGNLVLTCAERNAVAALRRLAKRWPKTLTLFSWSGTLAVFKPGDDRTYEEATVTTIRGIPNDGGDPPYDEVVHDRSCR